MTRVTQQKCCVQRFVDKPAGVGGTLPAVGMIKQGRHMPPSKAGSRAKKQQSGALHDFFLWRGIPPSPLHQALQDAAIQAGWSSPWELEQEKIKAGKSSGRRRAGRAQLRQSLLIYARLRLSPDHRRTPYANDALEALRKEYDNLLSKGADDPDPIVAGIHSALSATDRKWLKKASDETLKKDLQAIRRMRGVTRRP